MTDNSNLSVRIGKPTKERLAQLAKIVRLSQSSLAAEAIEEFVAVQEWQIAGIEAAMASADQGQVIAHDDVRSWIESLGSGSDLSRPSVKQQMADPAGGKP